MKKTTAVDHLKLFYSYSRSNLYNTSQFETFKKKPVKN